jgi:hypothetical protein
VFTSAKSPGIGFSQDKALAIGFNDFLALLDAGGKACCSQHDTEFYTGCAICSKSVSCGTNSICISPEIIFACVSQLSPMWGAIMRFTRPAVTSCQCPV